MTKIKMIECVLRYVLIVFSIIMASQTSTEAGITRIFDICTERPSFRELYGEDFRELRGENSVTTQAFGYLAEGARQMQLCAEALYVKIELLNNSDVNFEEDWNLFDRDLQIIINKINHEINFIRSRGGVLDIGQDQMVRIDEQIRQTQRVYASFPERMNIVINRLNQDKIILNDALIEIKSYSDYMNLRLIDLYKWRPIIATGMRRGQIIDAHIAIEIFIISVKNYFEIFSQLKEEISYN